MELTLTTNFGTLLSAGAFLNDENGSKAYTPGKEISSAALVRKPEPPPANTMTRRRKTYYTRLLEMLVRKTESEKRMEIFGSDPFR